MMNKDTQSSVFSSRRRGAFEIALLYLLIGILWIVFSDEAAAALAPNQAALTQISIYKGWGYVLVTALLLYWMIGLYTKRLSRAEWTLGESEKNYQELLQQASDGIFIADAQGQYTLVNEEGCRLLGYTQAELLSMNLRELIAPEDIQKTPPRLDELKNGKTLLSERILLRKDGSRILCEISAKQFPDGRYQSIIRDITERKVTDEALLRGEQRYRSLFENMTNGFARCQMVYDESGAPKDFIYLDINQAFENLTGLKNVLGKHVSTVIPGIRESNPELFEIYGRVALTGKPEKFETYVPGLRSGIWFSTSVYSTEKNFFVTVFEVITERKQAEAALRENEERLRLSLHAANQGLYDLNVQTGNTIVNREYAEMLGYDFDSFVETNAAWIERLHPDDRELTATAYADYIKGLTPEYRVEFRQKTKAGDWKWILSLGKVAEYDSAGKPLRMLGTHTDITVRKQAEETLQKAHDELEYQVQLRTQALSQTNTLLETMLEYMPDQIYFKDAESRFIRNSKAQTLALGLSDLSQVIGKTDFDFFPHAQRSYDEEQEIIRSGKPLVDFEEWVVWPSGQGMWVSTTKVPLRNQAGEIIGTFGISRDITERKRNEAALLKAKEELEFKVAERTTELSEINEQLELELSERKQAEEKLKASEFRFRLAAESLTDVIYEWDIKEQVDWFGDVDALMGYAPGTFPRTLTGWAALLHPDDQARVLAAVDAQLKGGASYNIEYRIATKHGEWRWWSARGVALRDSHGEPYHWIGSITDITERMQKNEALKKSEAKYRTLHESMIDGFVSVDIHGNFLECNEVYRNMLGYSDAELARLTYVEITPENWHAYETEVVENQILIRGFSDVYEKEYRRKDGTIFPVELHTVLLRDEAGTPFGMWAIVRDITERKQAEAKLRHSEEQYRLMFTSNPLPIFVFDRKTFEFLAVNDATVTQYGYSREELLQMTIKDIRPPEDIPTMLNLVAAKSAPYSNIGVVRHRKKDGTLIDVEITRHDILFDGHDALIVLINDVTERKQTEEKILDSELRYRRLFESAKDGILILDAETGLIVDVNPFLTTLLGYPYEYFLGKRLWELGFFKDIVANAENFQELLQKKYIRYEDLPLESANGKRMNVEFVSNVYQVDHHKVVQCNIRDITDRKQAEAAQLQSEQKFSTIFKKAPFAATLSTFPEGIILEANEEFERLLGYPLEDVIGRTSLELNIYPEPDTRARMAAEFKVHGFTHNVELKFQTKSGNLRHLLVNTDFVELAGKKHLLTTAQDITERKQTEAIKSQLAAIVDSSEDAIIGKTLEGVITSWNIGAERLYGYSAAEVIGQPISLLIPSDRQDELPKILAQLKRGESIKHFETERQRKDGTRLFVSLTISPIKDALGQITGASTIARDITERKRTEDALHEREQKLNTILNLLPVGVSILDQDRKVVYSNDTLGKILETTQAGLFRGDYRNRKYVRADGSEKKPEEFASTLAFTERTELHDSVTGIVKEDGHTIWTSVSAAPVDFPDWKVVLVTADITERKQAEETIRESQELFLKAFRANPAAMVITRLSDGTIIDLNTSYEQIFEYTREELIGKTSAQTNIMVDPEERNAIVEKLQADGHVYGYETTLRAKSGRLINTLFSIEMIEQAGEKCMLSIIYDFTERKHAEDELRASQKLLQDVVNNTAALVYILNLEGRFQLVNHKIETLFGLSNAQIVGKTRNAFMPAEFATQHRNNDLEIIQTGQGKLFEEENREPDGRHVYLTNKFPLFDTHNQVYAVCGISTDMTERKRMEEELQRSNAELEQFAYVASHDLQEPLRAVAGMVQLLGQRYQGKLDERADEYIGHAVEASERMQKLINDLLDYSRVNRLGRSFENTAVERSLNTALANLQVVIQESQAQITHDPLPSLMTDSGQLTQVLQNLIGNAIKFRGERPLHIHIGAKKIEGAWQFSVSDNGIGIESKYYERIFLVFQRLHTRREYPGTGIGLALCKKIIERHNGQIWVESQPGLGSTFYFTIPERQP